MPEQVCILITLTIAHTFANEPNVFLGLNHFQVSKKISPIAGFVANYLCSVLSGCLGGFLLSEALIGWPLEILF